MQIKGQHFLFPSPFDHNSLVKYIEAIAETNESVPGFSYRKLSAELGWPPSLIPDVCSGRRNLSLVRVLELAGYASMEPPAIERLVALLCLSHLPESLRPLITLRPAPERISQEAPPQSEPGSEAP